MTEKRKRFLLYNDWSNLIEDLSLEGSKELLQAIFDWQNGKSVSLNTEAKFVWKFIEQQFEKDAEEYKKKCEASREAINARWKRRNQENTTVYDRIPTNTKHTDNDIDNDNDIYKKKKVKKSGLVALSEITDTEMKKLFDKYGESVVQKNMELMRGWLSENNKKLASGYLFALRWIARDNEPIAEEPKKKWTIEHCNRWLSLNKGKQICIAWKDDGSTCEIEGPMEYCFHYQLETGASNTDASALHRKLVPIDEIG